MLCGQRSCQGITRQNLLSSLDCKQTIEAPQKDKELSIDCKQTIEAPQKDKELSK